MRKNRSSQVQRRQNVYLDRFLVVRLIMLIVLVSAGVTIYQNLKKTDVFLVKEVYVRQGGNIIPDDRHFNHLKNRNIFSFSLEREARSTAYYYPSYQKVRITRFLPDHLVVDLMERDPQAVIRAPRDFLVDENMILFEPPGKIAPDYLPVILGVEKYVSGSKYGTRCDSPAIAEALGIIKLAGSNAVLRGYRIKKLDFSGSNNASIFFLVPGQLTDYTKTDYAIPEQLVEIKLGREQIRNKLALLSTLLVQVKNNISNIEYIDLRFEEPVIKFKERK